MPMLRRWPATVLAAATLLVALSACAAGPNELSTSSGPQAAGFWLGLWHGLISPITFIVSLFTPQVSLYEVANNGNWYDFGFILGVSAVFSGSAQSRAAIRSVSGRGRAGRVGGDLA
jgi:hypothetical protein